jgi:hypothetical protein
MIDFFAGAAAAAPKKAMLEATPIKRRLFINPRVQQTDAAWLILFKMLENNSTAMEA